MSGLDVFIVNVGLGPIGSSLGESSLAKLSWVLNAYAIIFAALLVPAGRLADRYGAKKVFLTGLMLFSLGSLGAALSADLWLLVALRCVQAVGAAALVPSSLGLILTAMPTERIPRSVQIWAITGSLGSAAGPALGGILVEASWRWIFIVNIPIGVVALVVAGRIAPYGRHGHETGVPDLLGGALLMLGVGSLALALVQSPAWGWASGATISAWIIAVVALLLCVWRSARAKSPAIDLRLFQNRTFAWGNLAGLTMGIAFGIELLGLVLWLQEGWGWSAIRTGLAIAPGPVMVSFAALGLRRYTSKLPQGAVAAMGALLVGLGGIIISSSVSRDARYVTEVLPGWLVVGIGMGFALPTLVTIATAGLPNERTSTGSAVVQMGRQMGSVLGVAILIGVIGGEAVSANSLVQFQHSWWWAGGLAALAAMMCLPLIERSMVDAEPALAG